MKTLRELATHLVLWAAVIAALYPILWVVMQAVSASQAPEARVIPWPSRPSAHHFEAVVFTWTFARHLTSSIIVSVATAVVAIVIATPAAYAMSRFRFVGARSGERALLATQMFPGVAASIPLYLMLDTAGLLDTRTGLVLVYATSAVPFAIFQLRSAFDAIPRDLEEAAMVDGATRFGAFTRVVLPAARPALAVTALFAFMTAWNEFILAATFLTTEELYTLPILLNRYASEHDSNFGHFAAGAIVVSIPVMVLFYALQRQLVSGLTSGGVKG
jgi:arabinogalactan oligomer/maltooligosaccharide transport system permease protein